MQSRNERYPVKPVSPSARLGKRLGSYLVEAGLLTTAQLDVALNDQKMTEEMTGTHMQLGEIIAARGWVKEQTIEYLMRKVILPERRSGEQPLKESLGRSGDDTVKQDRSKATEKSAGQATRREPSNQAARREAPISKPLPSVPTDDGEVWVG